MAVQRLSLSAVGVSAPFSLPMKNQIFTGAGISLLLNFSGGGPAVATATVEVSNDPVAFSTPTLARWNAHDILVGITADKNNSIIYPINCLRLRLTAWTSGTVVLDIGFFDYSL
jgi:hypothetical protein